MGSAFLEPNFSSARMDTVESEGGENPAGREEAWKKSQASSPRARGKGQGARGIRTFIYRRAGWTRGEKQLQTMAQEGKTGCSEGQSLA